MVEVWGAAEGAEDGGVSGGGRPRGGVGAAPMEEIELLGRVEGWVGEDVEDDGLGEAELEGG